MCGFAFSRSGYRLGVAELRHILNAASREKIEYVRFTGGEPLIHEEIVEMIALVTSYGMRPSIITNGGLLEKYIHDLKRAGLEQVIVSIDGPTPTTHDNIRQVPGLFSRAVRGLKASIASGLRSRVNTVCGPSNFREIPSLQDLLTNMGVEQWELSSLKLERKLEYSERDRVDIAAVIRYVYDEAVEAGRLVPMGKIWCGNTPEERERYFETGVTPRPDTHCHVVRSVRYVDGRAQRLFPCSLLPHRPEADRIAALIIDWGGSNLSSESITACANRYYVEGPRVCTGCSTTAAGFSNDIELSEDAIEEDWAY
jgi:cytosylglucuronate decarboxylase